jgi:hypothetical protein
MSEPQRVDLEGAAAPAAAQRELLQGLALQPAGEEELRNALEKAFDYRGDVTITRHDGWTVEGYIFDRSSGRPLTESYVRLIPVDGSAKLTVRFVDIAAIAFSGRDTAAGKSWEAWVRKYLEKKAAGEKNIELRPESLD